MNRITTSASKLVLLSIVGTLNILALVAGIWAVIHGNLDETTKIILALFGTAVSFVLGYYFGSAKGLPDDINTPSADARTTSTVVSKTTVETKPDVEGEI